MAEKKVQKNEDTSQPPPPQVSITIECERKPVLYLPDGRVLVRKVGF